MFLWRFPSGRPAPPLAGILTLWSSDFPPSRAPVGARDGGRPATSTQELYHVWAGRSVWREAVG